jgi:DNA-binding HxlR family transcriptional regulator
MNDREAMCPRFEAAMKILGKRWTGLVIRVLLDGPARFSEMASQIPEMSDRMLAERLRELEAEAIVRRDVFPETPVRIEYRLTEKGRALAPVMDSVHAWADQWLLAPSGN